MGSATTSECSTSASRWVTSSGSPSRDRVATDWRSARVVPPTNTPIRRNRRRPGSSRSPWLQSRVARMVRCRGGRSRGPASRALSRRSSNEVGSSSRARAAASSRASGSPASLWQVAATAAASSGSDPHPGLTRCARSSSSRAAGDGVPSGRSRTSSGSTAYSISPRTRSGARLVVSTVRSGTASTSAATSGAAPRRCSALSRTRRRSCPAQAVGKVLGHRA